MTFWHGGGSNGKSTLLGAVQAAVVTDSRLAERLADDVAMPGRVATCGPASGPSHLAPAGRVPFRLG